jgi:cytochrome c-type biogenesis protein CcmE
VTVNFVVTGEHRRVPVRYSRHPARSVRRGSGVVAEGQLGPTACSWPTNLLAKHDENYVPARKAWA